MPNENARRLRRDATDAERRLWSALRDRRLSDYRFRRQYPIGRFIVDFACTRYRLIVEADGGQHADSEADRERTAWLANQGWRVLRFWNNDVLANTNGVVETILKELQEKQPLTRLALRARHPLPQCGRGANFAASAQQLLSDCGKGRPRVAGAVNRRPAGASRSDLS
jgi:very-short-patch-repair endonuclease